LWDDSEEDGLARYGKTSERVEKVWQEIKMEEFW